MVGDGADGGATQIAVIVNDLPDPLVFTYRVDAPVPETT